jgi:hypothetical protein
MELSYARPPLLAINRPPHAPPAIELSFNLNLLPPTSLEARKSSSRTKKKVAKRVAAKKRAAPKKNANTKKASHKTAKNKRI